MKQRLEPGQRVLLHPNMGVRDVVTGHYVREAVVERVDGEDVYVTFDLSGKITAHRYACEMEAVAPSPCIPIPISAAKRIAEDYGYHQVVIMARVTGEVEGSDEHITTYGINKEHCRVAAMMGDKLKEVAQWPGVDATSQKIADLEAQVKAQIAEMNNLKIEILERDERDADYSGDAWERDTKS